MGFEQNKAIQELADSLLDPPTDAEQRTRYIGICARTAAFLKNWSVVAEQAFVNLNTEHSVPGFTKAQSLQIVNERNPELITTDDEALEAIAAARNNIFQMISWTGNFISRAKSIGLAPPANPFLVIVAANVGRALFQMTTLRGEQSDDLYFTIGKLVDLVRAEFSGQVDLTKVRGSAQISSFSLNTAGLDSNGNNVNSLTGLLSFVPDADQIKRQKSLDALAALDFRKRIPRVVFTAEHVLSDGSSDGCVVGWKRMPDASGYLVSRHDVFGNVDKEFKLSNDQALASQESLASYLEQWVIPFYGNLKQSSLYSFLDQTVAENRYYTYRVRGFQNSSVNRESIFSVPSGPAFLSPIQLRELEAEIQTDVLARLGPGSSVDDVSPYPAIARKLFGDESLDWILAGLNTLGSFNRNETVDRVRSFSYLGAKLSFLNAESRAGRFIVPDEISSVVDNVTKSISTYGVSQTIAEVLDKIGMLFYFGEKDSLSADGSFKRAAALPNEATGILAGILAAIDPETATIDPRALSGNIFRGAGVRVSTAANLSGNTAQSFYNAAKPSEIVVPDISRLSNDQQADDVVQFVGSVSTDDLIDLTTFDGIGKLIRLCRAVFDFNPARAT